MARHSPLHASIVPQFLRVMKKSGKVQKEMVYTEIQR
jgi:hypothetical protein